MTLRQDILTTLAVGTNRRPFAMHEADSEVATAVAAAAARDAPDAALAATAIAYKTRRAGSVAPRSSTPAPAPAPDDSRPMLSSACASSLAALPSPSLTAEWLALAARSQRKPPPELIVDLLQLGTTQPLRTAIAEVVGPRGRWLALLNPAWHWAAHLIEPQQTWADGDHNPEVLAAIRRRDPATGRASIAALPAPSARLVAALAHGASAADIELLEGYLGASDEVATAARGVLARIPSSAIATAYLERALHVLRVKKGLFRSGVDVVPLKSSHWHDWGADDLKPPTVHLSDEQLHGVWRVVAAARPHDVCAALHRSSAELVKAVDESPFRAVLLSAWTVAAERHDDSALAAALLTQHPFVSRRQFNMVDPFNDLALLARLAGTSGLAEVVIAGVPTATGTLTSLLMLLDWPWSVELVDALITHVIRPLRPKASLHFSIPMLALRADARALPLLEQESYRLMGTDHPAAGAFDSVLATVRFRQQMHQEFAQ